MIKKIIIFFSIVFLFVTIPPQVFAYVATIIGAIYGAIAWAAGIGAATLLASMFWGAVLGTLGYLFSEALSPDMPKIGYNSPTYQQKLPVATATNAIPVPTGFGFCRVPCNIVRQTDPDNPSYIKAIGCYGTGEWDQIISHYINDIEWGYLDNTNHAYYEHLGTPDQSGVTNLFTDKACNFRNMVVTEYYLSIGDEIRQLQNINTIGRLTKCLEIGQDVGGTTSWTSNPAQILWHWYIIIEGYSPSDLDQNAFTALEEYCAQSVAVQDVNYSLIMPPASSATVKATSNLRQGPWTLSHPERVVDLTLSETGTSYGRDWRSNAPYDTDQRINFDFGRKVVITKIELTNYHNSGTMTGLGIQNFALQGSNTASDLDHVAYDETGSNWTDVQTGLTATEHVAQDIPGSEEFVISNTTGYRYYSLKIDDNYGGSGTAVYMGFRKIRFYEGNAQSSTTGDESNVRYSFNFNFDTKIDINDAKKIIWQSFNGKCIPSQGLIKPIWDGAQEHDGAGSLQTKSVKHAFDTDPAGGNVVKGSFQWYRLEHPNVFLINYLDSAMEFRKDVFTLKDDADVEARGEKVYEETCWYLNTRALAKRRCNFKYAKGRYVDFGCILTGWPDSQILEIYDRVTVTDAEAGWNAKDFIVVDKDEDQHGRSIFALEAYLSGIYSDAGFEEQPSYSSQPSNPNRPVHADLYSGVTLTFNAAGTTNSYYAGSLSVDFPVPTVSTYGYTKIWISTDASNYYWFGTDSDGSFTKNGMGIFYQPGDTVYVKIQNFTNTNVGEAMPSSAGASIPITGSIRIGKWFFGASDMWGGQYDINHVSTTAVIGNLDGTPKIALGPSADSITFAGTETGFIVDGAGNVRFGGVTYGMSFNASTGVLQADKVKVGSSTPYIDISGASTYIRSSDYVSGYAGAGFTLEPGLLEVGNAAIRGILRSAVVQYDNITAYAGNQIVAKGADVLAVDMTADDSSTVEIENDSGASAWSVDDILRMKDANDDEWLTISSVSGNIYTCARDEAGDYGADSNPAWTKGQAVVNYGQADDGFIYMTASEANAPYMSIAIHSGHPWSSVTTHMRFGNLNGSYGYSSDEYGEGLGQIGANQPNMVYDPTNGLRLRINTTDMIVADPSGDVYIAGSVTIGGSSGVLASSVDGWKHASDATKIDGGDIYTNTITATQINGGGLGTLTITSGKIAINTTDALEIQASGNVLVKQGGDIVMEGGVSGNPSLIRFADNAVPGQIRFEQSGDSSKYHKIYKDSTNDLMIIEPINMSAPYLGFGTSGNEYAYIISWASVDISFIINGQHMLELWKSGSNYYGYVYMDQLYPYTDSHTYLGNSTHYWLGVYSDVYYCAGSAGYTGYFINIYGEQLEIKGGIITDIV